MKVHRTSSVHGEIVGRARYSSVTLEDKSNTQSYSDHTFRASLLSPHCRWCFISPSFVSSPARPHPSAHPPSVPPSW